MKKIFALLAASTMIFGATTAANALVETAAEAAERLNACNSHRIISARYLDSGRLEVTCPAGSVSGATVMAGTGLAGGTGAAIAAVVVILLLVAGDDDDGTASTTSSTGS